MVAMMAQLSGAGTQGHIHTPLPWPNICNSASTHPWAELSTEAWLYANPGKVSFLHQCAPCCFTFVSSEVSVPQHRKA